MSEEFFEEAPPGQEMPVIGEEIPLYCTRGMSREEWKEKRRGSRSIGASQVASILGESKYGTPIEVWGEVVGRTVKEDDPSMQLGRAIEHFVAERVAKSFGYEDESLDAFQPLPSVPGVSDWPYVLRHKSIPYLTTNLDRVLRTDQGSSGLNISPLEIKWHGWRMRDHYEDFRRHGLPAIKNTPIMSHYIQLQAQMCVLGRSCANGYLGVVVGEEAGMLLSLGLEMSDRDLFIFNVRRDEQMISRIEAEVSKFWHSYVETGIMPPVTSHLDEAAARAAYSGEGIDDKKAKGGLPEFDDMREYVESFMTVKDGAEAMENSLLVQKARIIREMEVRRISGFSCGGYTVTYNADVKGTRKLLVKEKK